ncbi:TIGR02611 family protein [Phycicoccus sp. CMS6Z-2]|uniref:TIGR02611 family protein n=1 Tax=Phycicoccus flavus TaxID=2502783 RepID=A0A8T6R2D7_9MICO|nr:TIGR02611 family protein [Phycicoccus flavus]
MRLTVALVGLVLVGGGLVLVPLPGPGWLIVIVGIAVWASEIMPAQRLLDFAKDRLRRWERWMREQPRWVQLAVAAATFAFVAAVVWVVAKVLGVPGFVPDVATAWLEANLGL